MDKVTLVVVKLKSTLIRKHFLLGTALVSDSRKAEIFAVNQLQASEDKKQKNERSFGVLDKK